MINKNNIFKVPNTNSRDAPYKRVIYDIKDELLINSKTKKSNQDYICICSGGTTSSCARKNLVTIDLRKKYNQISFDQGSNLVRIGGGVLMKDLLAHLEKFGRTFPTGLSNLPGAGFILTGGISPLSRRYGLAIDNVESLKGFFGNGDYFSFSKKKLKKEDKKIWSAIKGAAPFLSIVTEIELNTFKPYPIQIIEGFVNEKELEELIKLSEYFPENVSLQWLYSEKIYIYIVSELIRTEDEENISNYLFKYEKFSSLNSKIYGNFNLVKFFPNELGLFELNKNNHSEVISLLGKELGNNTEEFISILKEINSERPNKSCYIATQQLGFKTKKETTPGSYFIHRESIWKPWIYTSWKKNDLKDKERALDWLNKSWYKLKKFFPKIHLAQLHTHLNSHKEEMDLAFGNKVDELKILKNIYDPAGNLPPL